MGYGRYLAGETLFWALLAGAFAGVGIALITGPFIRSADPSRNSSRRWVAATLSLTGVVAALALSVLVPDDPAPFAPESIGASIAGLLAVGLGLRFFRIAGLPILLLAGSIAMLGSWVLAPYVPIRTPTELARFTVLTMRPDELTVELTDLSAGTAFPRVLTVPHGRLIAAVEIAEPAPALFLLGGRRFARFVGFVDPAEQRAGSTPSLDSPSTGGSATLRGAAARTGALSIELVPVEARPLNVFRSFSLVVPVDGPAMVERR